MKCHYVVLLTLWPWLMTFQSQNHVTCSISQGHSLHQDWTLNTLGSFIFELCCRQTEKQTVSNVISTPTGVDNNEYTRSKRPVTISNILNWLMSALTMRNEVKTELRGVMLIASPAVWFSSWWCGHVLCDVVLDAVSLAESSGRRQ